MKWIIYQRGTIYPHAADMFLRGVLEYSEKLAGGFVSTLYINLGPKLFWSWRRADMMQLIKIILRKIGHPRKCRLHLHKLFTISQRAISVADRLRHTNLKNFSKQKLIKHYAILDQTLLPANGLLGVEVDAIDIGFENFFIKQLGQASGLKDEMLIEVSKKIVRPLYQSYITTQEQELIKVALKNKIKNDSNFNSTNENFTCTINGQSAGTHTIYIRSYDTNTSYTAQSHYHSQSYTINSSTSTFSSGAISLPSTRCRLIFFGSCNCAAVFLIMFELKLPHKPLLEVTKITNNFFTGLTSSKGNSIFSVFDR